MKNTTVDSLVSLMVAVISSAEGSCRKDGEKARWTRGQRLHAASGVWCLAGDCLSTAGL